MSVNDNMWRIERERERERKREREREQQNEQMRISGAEGKRERQKSLKRNRWCIQTERKCV